MSTIINVVKYVVISTVVALVVSVVMYVFNNKFKCLVNGIAGEIKAQIVK